MSSIFPNPSGRYVTLLDLPRSIIFFTQKSCHAEFEKTMFVKKVWWLGGNCSGTISHRCRVLCSSGESAERNCECWKAGFCLCFAVCLVIAGSLRLTENELYTSFVFIQ